MYNVLYFQSFQNTVRILTSFLFTILNPEEYVPRVNSCYPSFASRVGYYFSKQIDIVSLIYIAGSKFKLLTGNLLTTLV